jgi:hypothetical protein
LAVDQVLHPEVEKHYSVGEVAKMWGWSQNTIRRMFANEPGILEWGTEESRFKRSYTTLRIPESVIARVHRRLTKTEGSVNDCGGMAHVLQLKRSREFPRR